MKTLKVPLLDLDRLSDNSALLALEEKGGRFIVGERNWGEAYPYFPLCAGEIARSETSLFIHFHVRGLDLRIRSLRDNERQWEDSCCEFFCQDPDGGNYYNFELNAGGLLLSAIGPGRKDRPRRGPEQMALIRRYTSLSPELLGCERNGEVFSWDVMMAIPLQLIGIDGSNPPSSLRANFYKCADLSAHPHFLSWNPIDTPKPDFHTPEFFGELIFE